MEVKKRVLQISLDIIVGCKCNGTELAEEIATELNRRGYGIIGAGFHGDMTEYYKTQYSELFKDE